MQSPVTSRLGALVALRNTLTSMNIVCVYSIALWSVCYYNYCFSVSILYVYCSPLHSWVSFSGFSETYLNWTFDIPFSKKNGRMEIYETQ